MKKITLGKKLSLKKEKLNQLNEKQMSHFMGGRLARATTTGITGTCSSGSTSCCG
ncbi:MAG TPA: class I lanthipeptide [Puia sp.]|jgi:natural product precursor|nr:class I lanthipeptide [Puia sp.]